MDTYQAREKVSNALEGESKKVKSEEKEDSSSNESGSAKSGSGGSGGYNADCSASDQSSDDTGTRKEFVRDPLDKSAKKAESVARNENTNRRSRGKKTAKDTNTIDGLLDIESLLSRKPVEDKDLSFLGASAILPQLNGVRIKHPMDPRIDLAGVGWSSSTSTSVPIPVALGQDPSMAQRRGDSHAHQPLNEVSSTFPSVESYVQLLQMVRPFFHIQGTPLQPIPPNNRGKEGGSSSQADSSEGFTSFFTTTQAGSHNTTQSGSPNSSDFDKKDNSNGNSQESTGQDNSDGSSMAVLARVKRKHKTAQEESVMDSGSSGEKRVRIHEAANQEHETNPQQNFPPEGSTSSSSGRRLDARDSGSSSSADIPQDQLNESVPRRVVTDLSGSSKADSGISSEVSNRNQSGSGSATPTGSGSNPGSSGSGNEKGSSEEHKEGSGSGEDPMELLQHETQKSQLSDIEDVAREKKLLDKKRKRIEMRREYEAQQRQSSTNTLGKHSGDVFLKPGQPVTLDRVMMVSRIPRIVVQAIPPFMGVHTNAAYTHLTGNEAHDVAGRPISSLLSFLETGSKKVDPHAPDDRALKTTARSENKSQEIATMKHEANKESKNPKPVGLAQLVDMNAFGTHHLARVSTKKSHAMVGRNVSFVYGDGKPKVLSVASETAPERDELSNDTSLTSSFGEGTPYLTCRAIVAPVVSSPAMLDGDVGESAVVAKRSRHESGDKAQFVPQLVTHYVIQLQLHDGSSIKHESNDSLSSKGTSAEARNVGMAPSDIQRQEQQQTADTKELVAAIG